MRWFLLVLIAVVKGQDASTKSPSKLSDFKAKLARTDLLATSPELDKETLDISDLGISVPPEYANETVQKDHHTYYNSTFYLDPEDGRKFWINLEGLHEGHTITHYKLSDSYRQATTVELSFDFPFYGSPLRNVTIATGGFLYMGDYLHNWIAATQYIAPLMANFDTRVSSDSVIKYADNGTAFTVQWEKVFIQNREPDGAFTFQVTLLDNGDIVFAYKDVPYSVSSISDSQHPVKVGLSDAYILERAILFVRRKTVYEYNRIHIKSEISNNTALYFTALPTCNTFKDCSSCLGSKLKLPCNWCDAVHRCSDGIDRQRQSWVESGCSNIKVTECSAEKGVPMGGTDIYKYSTLEGTNGTDGSSMHHSGAVYDKNEPVPQLGEESKGDGVSTGALTTLLMSLVIVASVVIWAIYAYRNPQSSSGQFLIKYRPSRWGVRKDNSAITSANSRHL